MEIYYLEIIPDPPKSMEEILEIFDDDIYNSHQNFDKSKDITYFNQAVNWMIEDVKIAEYPKKLQIVSSLFRYLSVHKEIIFKTKDFLSLTKSKASEFLKYYKREFYTIYQESHDEMVDVLQNFLFEIRELEAQELAKEKQKDFEEYCKIFNIDPDFDKKYLERYPPSS